jgi:hypothetical protein
VTGRRSSVRAGTQIFFHVLSGLNSFMERAMAASAVLDRGDTWAIVGSGRAAAGPYHFEFSKPK